MPKPLPRQAWQISDVDYFEISKRSAWWLWANMKDLNITHEQTNVYGGTVSIIQSVVRVLRIPTALLSVLQQRKADTVVQVSAMVVAVLLLW